MSLTKPQIGQRCNGCGLCCKLSVCSSGSYIMGLVDKFGDITSGPCPALTTQKDGTYGCGIIIEPKKYIKGSKYPVAVLQKNFAFLIGAGIGCDELCDNDTDEEIQALQHIVEAHIADPYWHKKRKIAVKVIFGILED